MNFDDYIKETSSIAYDIVEHGDYDYLIKDQEMCDELVDKVMDEMFIDDSITGNGSGSFTFNAEEAKENIEDLLWDDDFIVELSGTGSSLEQLLEKGPEAVDVSARCFALSYTFSDIEKAIEERLTVLESEI